MGGLPVPGVCLADRCGRIHPELSLDDPVERVVDTTGSCTRPPWTTAVADPAGWQAQERGFLHALRV